MVRYGLRPLKDCWYFVAPATLAFILVLVSTHAGVSVTPDGIRYLVAAKSLLGGDGLTIPFETSSPQPLTQFPPLCSLAMVPSYILGVDPLRAWRFMNALCLALTVAFIAALCRSLSGSRALSAALAAIPAVSPDTVKLYSDALSEPLFLALLFAGIMNVESWLENRSSRPLLSLYGGAVFIGLSAAARYAGLALVAAAAGFVLFALLRERAPSLKPFFYFSALSCLPITLALTRNLIVSGAPTNRDFVFHPPALVEVAGIPVRLATSVFPLPIGQIGLRTITVFLGASLLLLVHRTVRRHRDARLLLVTLWCAYLAFLMFSRSFFDTAIQFQGRQLEALVFLAIPITAASLKTVWAHVAVRRVTWAAIAVSLSSCLFATATWFKTRPPEWQYAQSRTLDRSPTLHAVRNIPRGALIYTNAPDILYWRTGLRTLSVPRKWDYFSGVPHPRWCEEIRNLPTREDAYAVQLNIAQTGGFLPSLQDLERCSPGAQTLRFTDGAVLRLKFHGSVPPPAQPVPIARDGMLTNGR